MEKILKFKGKFPINPHLATINNNQISFYSEQSGNEEKVDIRNKSNKYPKHKTSKFIEEEEEEEKDEEPTKHHVNTLLIHKSNIKIFDTDNSEPNTPNGFNLTKD